MHSSHLPLAAIFTAISISAHAAGAPDPDAAPKATLENLASQTADMLRRNFDVGPFRLAIGPTDAGGFGTTVTGNGHQEVAWLTSNDNNILFDPNHIAAQGAFDYQLDAGWTTDANAPNNTSLSLKPTIELMWTQASMSLAPGQTPVEKIKELSQIAVNNAAACAQSPAGQIIDMAKCGIPELPTPRAYIGIFGDLRYRFGTLTQSGQPVHVNQAILGGGLSLVTFTPHDWTVIRQWPTLSAGYYTVQDTQTNAAVVPAGIEADYLKVSLSTKLNLGPRRKVSDTENDSLFYLYLDADGSKATTGPDRDWQALYKAQLVCRIKGEIKPALTYRFGKEQGLDYDKALILGIVMELR